MKKNIAIAFSGGGIRAMAFHAGVLLYLSEQHYLERISVISSVSGGSLLTGLIFSENNGKWPSSKLYNDEIYNKIKNILCNSSLQKSSMLKMLTPSNWKFLRSRSNIISKVIAEKWSINCLMQDLANEPHWIINGTTAETGKRFRISKEQIGDYQLGFSKPGSLSLNDAMSISAAFPGLIGPYSLLTKDYNWRKKEHYTDPDGSEKSVKVKYKKINIYDGGVYDNLGTEPLFNHGSKTLKKMNLSLIVSDAGSRLKESKIPFFPHKRLLRLSDIILEQVRSLRVRSLMDYFLKAENDGCYIMIGQNPSHLLANEKYKFETLDWQSNELNNFAMSYKTNLKKMKPKDFNIIAKNGYELVKSLHIIKNGY